MNDRRDFMKIAAALAGAGLAARHAHAQVDPTDAFISSVKNAKLFDLSHTWDENSPIAGVNPPYSMTLNATHAGTRGTFDTDGQLSFTSEIQHWSGQHGAPSIDAIGHIGHNGKLFGGVDAAAATSDPRGIGRDRKRTGAHLDIAHYPKEMLVNRGVLLDVARVINGNNKPLEPTVAITDEHLHGNRAAAGCTAAAGRHGADSYRLGQAVHQRPE